MIREKGPKIWIRRYHDFLRYPTTQGRTFRVPLKPGKLIGAAVSRGTRNYQEDTHTVSGIQVPWRELQSGLKRDFGVSWNPEMGDMELANQVLFVGLFDGHGGPAVSQFIRDNLHDRFETVDENRVKPLIAWLKQSGGYFRRFRGGALEEWIREPPSHRPLDLEARATLAFLQVDYEASKLPEAEGSGATASVALLQPLEIPPSPFYSSEYQCLTVAHCGDTRVLLCATESGKSFPMTENHHAETRGEAARLRRIGTGIVTDSYGEARWMGAVANTRGLGDSEFKPFGVTPEPEVRRRILKGKDWAFMVLVSDGVSSTLSDDEIVDLARNTANPSEAAQAILSFAEELGSEDNCSVVVIPLAGWGTVRGPDRTGELRAYRKRQSIGSERQRRM